MSDESLAPYIFGRNFPFIGEHADYRINEVIDELSLIFDRNTILFDELQTPTELPTDNTFVNNNAPTIYMQAFKADSAAPTTADPEISITLGTRPVFNTKGVDVTVLWDEVWGNRRTIQWLDTGTNAIMTITLRKDIWDDLAGDPVSIADVGLELVDHVMELRAPRMQQLVIVDTSGVSPVLTAFPYTLSESATAQAGAASTITLAAGANDADDFYNGARILITENLGEGQIRTVSAYNGTSKIATIIPAWTTTPEINSKYTLTYTAPSWDGDLRLYPGYNIEFDSDVLNVVQSSNSIYPPSRLGLGVKIGGGAGLAPTTCGDTSEFIRSINGVAPNENGNFVLTLTDCYRWAPGGSTLATHWIGLSSAILPELWQYGDSFSGNDSGTVGIFRYLNPDYTKAFFTYLSGPGFVIGEEGQIGDGELSFKPSTEMQVIATNIGGIQIAGDCTACASCQDYTDSYQRLWDVYDKTVGLKARLDNMVIQYETFVGADGLVQQLKNVLDTSLGTVRVEKLADESFSVNVRFQAGVALYSNVTFSHSWVDDGSSGGWASMDYVTYSGREKLPGKIQEAKSFSSSPISVNFPHLIENAPPNGAIGPYQYAYWNWAVVVSPGPSIVTGNVKLNWVITATPFPSGDPVVFSGNNVVTIGS